MWISGTSGIYSMYRIRVIFKKRRMYTCLSCGASTKRARRCSCAGAFYCSEECRKNDEEKHVLSGEHELFYIMNNLISKERRNRMRRYITERSMVMGGPKRPREEEEKKNVGKEEETDEEREKRAKIDINNNSLKENAPDYISSLPDELLLPLMRYINPKNPDVARLSSVSPQFRRLAIYSYDPSFDDNKGLAILIKRNMTHEYDIISKDDRIKPGSRYTAGYLNNNEAFDLALKSDAVDFFDRYIKDETVIKNIQLQLPKEYQGESDERFKERTKSTILLRAVEHNSIKIYNSFKGQAGDLSFNGNWLLVQAVSSKAIDIVNDLLKDRDVVNKLKGPMSTFVRFKTRAPIRGKRSPVYVNSEGNSTGFQSELGIDALNAMQNNPIDLLAAMNDKNDAVRVFSDPGFKASKEACFYIARGMLYVSPSVSDVLIARGMCDPFMMTGSSKEDSDLLFFLLTEVHKAKEADILMSEIDYESVISDIIARCPYEPKYLDDSSISILTELSFRHKRMFSLLSQRPWWKSSRLLQSVQREEFVMAIRTSTDSWTVPVQSDFESEAKIVKFTEIIGSLVDRLDASEAGYLGSLELCKTLLGMFKLTKSVEMLESMAKIWKNNSEIKKHITDFVYSRSERDPSEESDEYAYNLLLSISQG